MALPFRARLRRLFPCLPQQLPPPAQQSGRSKRLRKAAGLIRSVNRMRASARAPRQTLIGGKNYFGRGFERELSEHGVQLLRPAP